MRKLVSYIVLIVMMMVLPFVVNAASATVGISCPSSAKAGETISCNINVTTDVNVNGLALNYTFNGASYVGFTPSSGFTAQYTSANGFNVGNNDGKSGSYTIGVLKVKNSENYYIEINPRFGGGYPHAYECGVDHMILIKNNLNGIANEKNIGNYKNDDYMMKYNEIKII